MFVAPAFPPRSGLLLPPGVVQPFFLRFDQDDWHVMALLDGHPTYEAVEAMVRARSGGGWSVRAIITRHDGVQLDHVNDPALLAAMRGARRQVVEREIAFSIDAAGPRPAAHLSFISAADEPVELCIIGLGAPDPRGAGLSDPGTHSANTSLPLMWRKASALAAEGTHVMVSGRRYEAPVRVLRPGVEAREGYMTAGHSMGVIRAGEVRTRLLRAPSSFAAGEEWVFEESGDTVVWRIVERTASRSLIIERLGDRPEVISADLNDDRLTLDSIAIPDKNGLVITFFDGRFDIGVEGNVSLVSGRIETARNVLTLRPETPDWAIARPVRVEITRAGDEITIVTDIGELEEVEFRPAK